MKNILVANAGSSSVKEFAVDVCSANSGRMAASR